MTSSRLRFLSVATGVILMLEPAVASILLMPRQQLIKEADFIGYVQVLDTRRRPEADLPIEERVYYLVQEANALILHTIKGAPGGIMLRIAFDNSALCPNVQYDRGATYLVFLRRMSDGSYETVNHEQGRQEVHNGWIWYWGPEPGQDARVQDVVRDIQEYIERERRR